MFWFDNTLDYWYNSFYRLVKAKEIHGHDIERFSTLAITIFINKPISFLGD
jgi:hypothetical protein